MFFFRKIMIFMSGLRKIFDRWFSLPDGFLKNPKYIVLSIGGIGFLDYNKFYLNKNILLYAFMMLIVMIFPIKITFIILNIFIILGMYFIHDLDYLKNQIPEYVIIDKAIGVLIPMIVIGNETGIVFFSYIIISLILYHLLTKYKFWIVALTYNKIAGNLAVILDDIVAGIMVGLIVLVSLIFV